MAVLTAGEITLTCLPGLLQPLQQQLTLHAGQARKPGPAARRDFARQARTRQQIGSLDVNDRALQDKLHEQQARDR